MDSFEHENHGAGGPPPETSPYDDMLRQTQGDPAQVQAFYESHRQNRNQRQREALLDPAFPGVVIDPVLEKLVGARATTAAGPNPVKAPAYVDPRHCLVFWARPPAHIRALVTDIQQKLLTVAPNLWLMPADCLHMTVLEITHSRSADEIAALVDIMRAAAPDITDYTFSHRARLVKPMLNFDASAVALSFVPAAGEPSMATQAQVSLTFEAVAFAQGTATSAAEIRDAGPTETTSSAEASDDGYTYHHLRGDVWRLCRATGVDIASRYVLPSAHLTVARFITQDDFSRSSSASDVAAPAAAGPAAAAAATASAHAHGNDERQVDPAQMRAWVETVDDINAWLQREFWPKGGHIALSSGTPVLTASSGAAAAAAAAAADTHGSSSTATDGQTSGASSAPRPAPRHDAIVRQASRGSNADDSGNGIEWIVGHEKGLDWRCGTLWYGGGQTLRLGKGFRY